MKEKLTPTESSTNRTPLRADLERIVKKRVIADTLISLRPGESLAVRVVSSPRTLSGGSERWGKNGPPSVLQVETYPDLKPAMLILQTVLESKFEILGEDAIGHSYLIEAGAEVPGKRYRAFDVTEIEYEE